MVEEEPFFLRGLHTILFYSTPSPFQLAIYQFTCLLSSSVHQFIYLYFIFVYIHLYLSMIYLYISLPHSSFQSLFEQQRSRECEVLRNRERRGFVDVYLYLFQTKTQGLSQGRLQCNGEISICVCVLYRLHLYHISNLYIGIGEERATGIRPNGKISTNAIQRRIK